MKPFFYSFLLVTIALSARAQWAIDGSIVCGAANNQATPVSVSDGKGGSIIVWADGRKDAGDIYAQRIDAQGRALWAANGVPVCAFDSAQGQPAVASDGIGGVVITWLDGRNNHGGQIPNYDIFAQRLDSAGNAKWGTNGVAVCTDTIIQLGAAITSDGAGGAVIGWTDLRKSDFTAFIIDADIYAQRFNAAGQPQWLTNGIAIADGPKNQGGISGATSSLSLFMNNNNYYFFWPDTRNDTSTGFQARQTDVYGQMVNASGLTQWTPASLSAVSLSNVLGNKNGIHAVSDGAGGALVSWADPRDITSASDIYAQRVDNAGTVKWQANGVAVNAATGNQTQPQMISDGKSGAIISWLDTRNDTARNTRNYNIYAQRISNSGTDLWNSNGIGISTADSSMNLTIAGDGSGGMYIAWRDGRRSAATGDRGDIYAERLDSMGTNLWNTNGNPVSLATGIQTAPSIVVSPGGASAGGAIIAFADQATQGDANIRANFISSNGVALDVKEKNRSAQPFTLSQNYPNPFRDVSTVGFFLTTTAHVRLELFDALGRKVATPVDATLSEGRHETTIDARSLPAGTYTVRIITNEGDAVRTMIVSH